MPARAQAVLAYIVARCKEASTWRGAILVATALTGWNVPEEKAAAITLIGIAAAGLVGMLFGERTPPAQDPKGMP